MSGAYVFGITTIVIICLGLFFAGQPSAYREGALILAPPGARPRMREVMNEMGQVLRSWLLGQLVRSAIVATVLAATLYSLGVPGAGLLGLQAGVANFIPYLGPLIAALPIALVTMPLGLSTLAWVLAIYFLIQTIEGFVIAPLIQKGSVNVAPAWTLFAIVLFGATVRRHGRGAGGAAARRRPHRRPALLRRGLAEGSPLREPDLSRLAHGLVDALHQVGMERIGRGPQQRIEIEDQYAALAARRDGAQVDAELVAVVGLHAVERIVHRKRQGDVRQRKEADRKRQLERSDLLVDRAGLVTRSTTP